MNNQMNLMSESHYDNITTSIGDFYGHQQYHQWGGGGNTEFEKDFFCGHSIHMLI